MLEGRGHLHDLVVLDVQAECTSDAAIPADRLDLGLARLVPRTGLPVVVLALEHERAGGADGYAVAAIDTGGAWQRNGELRRNARVEPAASNGDGKGVLEVVAAGLDALVAEDALRVIAHVEVIVDFDRLRDARRGSGVVRVVVTGVRDLARALGFRRRGRSVAVGPASIVRQPRPDTWRGREIDGRGQELKHHLAAVPHSLGVGADDHLRLDLARACGHEHARTFQLDDTNAADVHRMQRAQVAERRDGLSLALAGLEEGGPLVGAHGLTVDLELHRPPRPAEKQKAAHRGLPPSKRRSRLAADSTAP